MLDTVRSQGLKDVCKTVEICHCPIHRGSVIEQLDAKLPNGKQLRVMLDNLGYHVAIGNRFAIERAAPPGVSGAEAWQMIAAELQG